MKIIGLTGGIASGKSTVASLFAERGAVVLDADRHAHAVLEEPAVRDALVERWGEEILSEDGTLARRAVAERVFGDGAEADRRFLEGLVHPRVRERLRAEIDAARASGVSAVVLDIPLLLEAGWADACDAIYFVDCPQHERVKRAAARGWSEAELAEREASQTSIEEKRQRSDAVIPSSEVGAAESAVDRLWNDLGLAG